MPDNLTVQISADSSRFRAEIAKLQAELTKTGAALRQAVKAGDTAQVNALAASYENTRQRIAYFNRQLRDTVPAAEEASGALGKLGAAVESVDRKFGALTTAFKGFAALETLELARKGFEQFSQSLEHFRQVRGTAMGSGLDPDVVKAFDLAMTRAGLSGEKTAGSLMQFAGAAGEALAKYREANKEALAAAPNFKMVGDAVNTAAQSMTVAKGAAGNLGQALVQVNRGGQKLDEFRDTFAGIDVDITKFIDATGRLDINKLLEATAKALTLKRQLQPAAAGRGGALLFGEDDIAKQAQGIDDLGKNFDALKKKARDLPPTQADLDRLKEWDAKVAEVNTRTTAWRDSVSSLGIEFDLSFIRGVDKAGGLLGDLGRAGNTAFADVATAIANFAKSSGLTDLFVNFWAQFSPEGQKALEGFQPTIDTWVASFKEIMADPWKAFSDAAIAAWDTIQSYFMTGITAIWNAIKSVWSTLSDIGSKVGSTLASIPLVPGYAAGGRVPGSGNTDSVPALLMPGEFVVRKAAVAHYGTDLFRALNAQRYALGGLVDRLHGGLQHFADGGLVTATTSDGITVNLHFPGGSFALRGDRSIVQGLTREARRASMLSAGRVPGVAAA